MSVRAFRECFALVEREDDAYNYIQEPCSFKGEVVINWTTWTCPSCGTEHDEVHEI